MSEQSGPITQQYNARVLEVVPRGGVLRTTRYDVKAEIISANDENDRRLEIIPLDDIPQGRAYKGMEFLIRVTVNNVTECIDECFASGDLIGKIIHKDTEAKKTYVGIVYKVEGGEVYAYLLMSSDGKRMGNWRRFNQSDVTGECVPCNYSEDRVIVETKPTHYIEELDGGKVLIRPAYIVYPNWLKALGQSIVIRKKFRDGV